MIYLIAPYTSVAKEWCDAKGIDFDSVIVITKKEDIDRRPGPGDLLQGLPGADPSLFFELTVRPSPPDSDDDIPSNPALW